MVVPPALTLLTPSVLVIERSATGVTVFVSLAELLPEVGSDVPAGGVIVALFVMLPVALPATVAVTVKVNELPTGKLTLMPLPCRFATVTPAPGQTAPPVPPLQLTPVTVRLATAGSVSDAPVTTDGPA